MKCYSCGSEQLSEFLAEVAIHVSRPDDLKMPNVMLFPRLLICLHCGAAEFNIPEGELRSLVNRGADAATSG